MNNTFMRAVKDVAENEFNVSVTENGALGYRTTGKALLDINFSVASLRDASYSAITQRFLKAFHEDPVAAMKWLFYARDVRGGLGERRLFRIILQYIASYSPKYIVPLIELIPEYGRYDDILCLLHTDLCDKVIDFISCRLREDLHRAAQGQPISLLAKWLPSTNASSASTCHLARYICYKLGMSEGSYRKTLSFLRRHLKVVERQMSAKAWDTINYESVPSRANLIYKDAFMRHDPHRRADYLSRLEKGYAKINSSALFPHDIVNKYRGLLPLHHSTTLEQLWKSLPDTVRGCDNTIVVADGSGSMRRTISDKSRVQALDVANALAIYFSERSSGQFKDQYITFSENPVLVDLGAGKTLREKISIALSHSEVANTNIEAVFDLVLKAAVKHHMAQEELPKNILIISDMEFDCCACANTSAPTARLFEEITARYARAGYKMPRLVFWNVNSRSMAIPVRENDMGVALISGFSPNITKMVMSGKTDPYECLLETLNADRYAPIANALANL